jgi:hypothetical protein
MLGKTFEYHRTSTILMAVTFSLALIWPAIWNGLPLFFSDSGAYLHVGWGRYWLVDRSSFYGLFLKPFVIFSDLPGFWLALIPQFVAIVWVLIASARRLTPAGWHLLLPLLLAATTGPWHASQLMPDAFAPVVILLGWFCASRDPAEPGSPLLLLAAAALSLTHSTYPALFLASGTAALAVLCLSGLSFSRAARRAAALAFAIAITVITQLSANAYYSHRAVYAPKSSAFLYASLNEDGLIEPWLRENCPHDRQIRELCKLAPSSLGV